MEPLNEAPLYGSLLDLPTHIRQGWKGLQGLKTKLELMQPICELWKRFITLASEINVFFNKASAK